MWEEGCFFFFLTPGKHRFKSVIFQIETIKVISIFTSSFSPFVNLCEVIRFSIRILTQFRNWYLSKSPFYKSSWRGETWLVLWQYFEIVTRIMPDNILPKHIRILGTPYSFCKCKWSHSVVSNSLRPHEL